jgi:hypothetical protein
MLVSDVDERAERIKCGTGRGPGQNKHSGRPMEFHRRAIEDAATGG